MNGLRKRVFQGLAWRSLVDVGNQVLLIAFTAVLARLLTRADFGLVAMALLFNRFVQTMTQLGLGTAVIQSREVTEAQVSAVFLIQVGLNFAVSLACFLGAPLAADFFHEPKLTELIQVLAWLVFINSFGFPQVLLRKRLQFGGYSLLEMGSMVAGNLMGIVMALKGFGVWSLVWRLMTQHLCFSLAIWPLAKWRPVKPQFAGISKLFRFGLNMLGANISYYFSQNLAAIITGKFIGVETLGSFNIAYNLAIVPAQKIQSVLTAVLGPAFATFQADIAGLKKRFYASVFSLGIIFIPMMLGLSAVAQNFVLVVYGEKWREAGLFLIFLALAGLLKGIEHLMRSVILSTGGASTVFKITMAETAASLPLLFIGSYYFGVMGLIISYMAASLLAFVLSTGSAQKVVEDTQLFARATRISLMVGAIMFAAVFLVPVFIPFHILIQLLSQIILGAVLYLVLRFKLLTEEETAIMKNWPLAHLVPAWR